MEESVKSVILIVEIGLVAIVLILVIDDGLRPGGWVRPFGSAVSRLFKRLWQKRPTSAAKTTGPARQGDKPDLRIVKDGGPSAANNNGAPSVYHFQGPYARKSEKDRKRPPPEKSN